MKPKPKLDVHKRKAAPKQRPSTSSESSVGASHSGKEDDSTQAGRQKAESIVWDIELLDHAPGSGSEVTKSNTMVVNARRPNWDTSQVHPSKPTLQPQASDDRAGVPADGATSVLSLRPSQSASQILTEEPREPDKAGISRYFPAQEHHQEASEESRSEKIAQEVQLLQTHPEEPPHVLRQIDPQLEPERRTDIEVEPESVLAEVEPATLRHSRPPSRDSLYSLDRELQSVAGLKPHLSYHSSDGDSHWPTFCRAYDDSALSVLVSSEPPDGVYLDHSAPSYLPTGEPEIDMMSDSALAANEDELLYDPVFISDAFQPEGCTLDDESENLDQAHLDLDLIRDDPTEDDLYYADESHYVDVDGLEDMSQDLIPQSFWKPLNAENIGRHAYMVQEDSGLMIQDDSMVEAYTDDCPDETATFSDTLSIGANFAAADYAYETSSIEGIETDTEQHAAVSMEMQCFSQGRALLLGIANDSLDCEDDHREETTLNRNYRSLSKIEEDVAKHMKGHWLPQRL